MATEAASGSPRLPDPPVISRSMADIAERSRGIVLDWLRRQGAAAGDPLEAAGAFLEMTTRLMAGPARVMTAQLGFWQDYMTLWQHATRHLLTSSDHVSAPAVAAAWKGDEVVDFIKQSYLLSARAVQQAVGGVDRRTAQQLDYYARQFIGAMSPANFLLTNARILDRTVESGGENLLRGLNNLLTDLERGRVRLGRGDDDRFVLGETIGATPGTVVAQNAVMQLIQYRPSTDMVLKRPLLIVPPWINKFYVLDLRPGNSFVRWAVAQGHTVFMISWVDPDARTAGLGIEAYLKDGILTALDAIVARTGETAIDTLGYCLGGTLLACAAALTADDRSLASGRIASATFLASLLDYGEAGPLGVFIDEAQLDQPSGQAPAARHLLRSFDLLWSFVVNTYLLGSDQFPFDLLHWNADQARVPSELHQFYLRHIYQGNELATSGAMRLLGHPIDLRRIDMPTYFLAARDDHIAPWRSAYRGTQLVGGPTRFVLAGSGHGGGIVNPPRSGRHGHRVAVELPPDALDWFASATEIAGSWWPDWHRWAAAGERGMVRARVPVDAIEAAPGSYVRRAC